MYRISAEQRLGEPYFVPAQVRNGRSMRRVTDRDADHETQCQAAIDQWLAELRALHIFGVQVQCRRVVRHGRQEHIIGLRYCPAYRMIEYLTNGEFFKVQSGHTRIWLSIRIAPLCQRRAHHYSTGHNWGSAHQEITMKLNRREFTKAGLGAASLAALGPAIAYPQHIIRKAIPSSGEKVPIIGLGTNRYGVGESAAARAPLRAALERFHQLGGTLIDTAPSYRTSESVLGDLIDDLGIRNDLFVATKTDKPNAAETGAQMEDSASRLKMEMFDLMQVHNLRGWKTALPVMREWQQEGRIRYIGMSTSRAAQYEDFEAVMRKEELDFIQINYSLEQREAADRILPLAKDRGVAVIINRAFGGGRIFDTVGQSPLPDWAKEFGCESWAQFLLKYAVGHSAATLAIPGMTKLHHVDDNFGAAHGRLPDTKERKRQEAFYDAL